ncbi:sialidase [Pedobacter sp. BS3]|uniref:sialidase family protein n=1 Tax=Pedobacter sp. BS3 TaxID=2567937 RepID=UPI0011EF2B6D|nr:sialidase family protein [Pedobacter sp. BS3]TZF81878.1 sialidase [Pedobacter sp. BS3]
MQILKKYIRKPVQSVLVAGVGFLPFTGNAQSLVSSVNVDQAQFQIPVLIDRNDNPLVRIKVTVNGNENHRLKQLVLSTQGTTSVKDITAIQVYYCGDDTLFNSGQQSEKKLFGEAANPGSKVIIKGSVELSPGVHYFWVTCALSNQADLLDKVSCQLIEAQFADETISLAGKSRVLSQRIGVAVRQHMADGIHTSRIPGLAVTNKGTLLAIFDARRQSARDLQGDIDIGLHRSTDGGQTWQPLQIAMDMGQWGGLPEKFNGVSDACILVDKNSDAIYIAALWMHGVLDKQGHWIEGLTENSTDWNHQWKDRGSQPGYDVRQSAQFMLVKSTDDGKTWSKPVNITKMCKQEQWWLLAPAPGNGITLFDGTLVFPAQGRDESGKPFSTIVYSKDQGHTWKTANRALKETQTTECAVVQLSDSSLMLNMRANKNKGNLGADNGRAVCVTHDLGQTWQPHPTSFKALPEPVCMGSLYKHTFTEAGKIRSMLLFSNPDSKSSRDHLSIKPSFDEGMTWPKQILLDELKSRGYSCITSTDEKHVGILYESSQADMVFQKITLSELLKK